MVFLPARRALIAAPRQRSLSHPPRLHLSGFFGSLLGRPPPENVPERERPENQARHGHPDGAGAPGRSVQPTRVVGTFIFRFPGDDTAQRPQVALFRRSPHADPYPHQWGVISGTVEETDPTPLAAALRELGEELGLNPQHLLPFRAGRPWVFRHGNYDDESYNGGDYDCGGGGGGDRQTVISPFAMALRGNDHDHLLSRLNPDEHSGYQWFDPAEVGLRSSEKLDDGNMAAGLRQSFLRVWPEDRLGPVASALMQQILADSDLDRDRARPVRMRLRFADLVEALHRHRQDEVHELARLAAHFVCENSRAERAGATGGDHYAQFMAREVVAVLEWCLSVLFEGRDKARIAPLAAAGTDQVVKAIANLRSVRSTAAAVTDSDSDSDLRWRAILSAGTGG